MAKLDIPIEVTSDEVTFNGESLTSVIEQIQAALSSGAPSTPSVAKFDNTHSPVGLWNFDGDLTENSGDPSMTLVKYSGPSSSNFYSLPNGMVGLSVDVGDAYELSVADSAPVKLQGDMSMQIMVRMDSTPTGNMFLASFGEISENEIDNMHYELMFKAPVYSGRPSYFHEHANGANDEATTTETVPALGELYLLGFTRLNNEVQLYLNGAPMGALETGLNAMTGGANGKFLLGGIGFLDSTCNWVCCGLKINDVALTSSEMLAEYNRTLGSV